VIVFLSIPEDFQSSHLPNLLDNPGPLPIRAFRGAGIDTCIKPYHYSLSSFIDERHESYLTVPLIGLLLVNVDLIDPVEWSQLVTPLRVLGLANVALASTSKATLCGFGNVLDE
jgi:hypothetical protein